VNARLISVNCRLPSDLQDSPTFAAVAAFHGSLACFRVFINLSFDRTLRDLKMRSIAYFGCAGGCFDLVRELENLGDNFETVRNVRRSFFKSGSYDYNPWGGGSNLIQELPVAGAIRHGRIEIAQHLLARAGRI
jgi:hypothetical protein